MSDERGMRMGAVVGKIRNIKTFLLQTRTRITRITPQETTSNQIHSPPPLSLNSNGIMGDEGACSHANCSSYNMGFPLRTCVRGCSAIGMLSSLLYIIAGTSLITHISQTETVGFSTFTAPQPATATTRHIYYKRNVGFFIGIAVILVILNVIQLLSDLFLFISTFRSKKCNYNFLWVTMVLHITLWIMTLICFITIFSGGGLFLLLVFLLGTAVRAYITFILHEYMVDETFKIDEGQEEFDPRHQHLDVEKCTPKEQHHHHHNQPSPIPEEITTVEPFPPEIPENNGYVNRGDEDTNNGATPGMQIIKPDKGQGFNQDHVGQDMVEEETNNDGPVTSIENNGLYSYPNKEIEPETGPAGEGLKRTLGEKGNKEKFSSEVCAGESPGESLYTHSTAPPLPILVRPGNRY